MVSGFLVWLTQAVSEDSSWRAVLLAVVVLRAPGVWGIGGSRRQEAQVLSPGFLLTLWPWG